VGVGVTRCGMFAWVWVWVCMHAIGKVCGDGVCLYENVCANAYVCVYVCACVCVCVCVCVVRITRNHQE